jgi:hypothetical protein
MPPEDYEHKQEITPMTKEEWARRKDELIAQGWRIHEPPFQNWTGLAELLDKFNREDQGTPDEDE